MVSYNSCTLATLLVLLMISPPSLRGQTTLSDVEPHEYFDFWVGTWELTWEAPDGTIETGTNRIEKILGGKVILENFRAETGRFEGYEGKSVSVYQTRNETWRQTWVDSESAYLDLTGQFEGNKRIFLMEDTDPNGEPVLKRMVFYDIAEDTFTWDWELSTDQGATWKLQWRINYKRSE